MTEIITKEYRIKITGTPEEHKIAEPKVKNFADEMCCLLNGLYSETEYYIFQFVEPKSNKPVEMPMIEVLEEKVFSKSLEGL